MVCKQSGPEEVYLLQLCSHSLSVSGVIWGLPPEFFLSLQNWCQWYMTDAQLLLLDLMPQKVQTFILIMEVYMVKRWLHVLKCHLKMFWGGFFL